MAVFSLDENDLDARLCRARARAENGGAGAVIDRAREGGGLDADDLALLWFTPGLDTEALYDLALAVRRPNPSGLETFSPLYMTNTCDADCRMCGMRRDNRALRRETVTIAEVEKQLRVLQLRGMHAVALLTGEYRAEHRGWALDYVNRALCATQAMGFAHVLINVGSIDEDEFDVLLAGIARGADGCVLPKLTMCTFQETYSRPRYRKFMGSDPDNPRADFDRRLANFDRSHRAGMRVANPGILVGLNPDLAYEITALALHAEHLQALGMEVYLSVPRLRQVAGARNPRGASDEGFIRLVSLLSLGLPACKIVITTREPQHIQQKLVPIVTVLSAGSASVAPYTPDGARFDLETSQFEVIDQRPFEAVLGEFLAERQSIENFHPVAPGT